MPMTSQQGCLPPPPPLPSLAHFPPPAHPHTHLPLTELREELADGYVNGCTLRLSPSMHQSLKWGEERFD